MIARWSDGIADDNMAEDILVDLGGLIARHPWWKARADLTLTLLDRLGVRPPMRILDAGCGWGTTLEALERKGYHAVGADISRRALEKLDRPGRELVEADLTKPLPEGVETSDAVLALDVLEHLDDDRAAVERLGTLARPGGVVVVSVPALPTSSRSSTRSRATVAAISPRPWARRSSGPGSSSSGSSTGAHGWSRCSAGSGAGRDRGRASRTAQVYRRYLSVPPWPSPLLLRGAFALERDRAIAGKLRTGTSLFAVARRPGEAPR